MLIYTPRQAAIKVYDLLVIEYVTCYDVENIILLNKTRAYELNYPKTPVLYWYYGPYYWAYNISLSDEVLALKGVYVEPFDSYTLCFYEEGSNDIR